MKKNENKKSSVGKFSGKKTVTGNFSGNKPVTEQSRRIKAKKKSKYSELLELLRRYRYATVAILLSGFMLVETLTVYADPSVDELTDERDSTQDELNEVNGTIEELADEQEEVEDNIEEVSCALVQVMAELEVVKQNITDKEAEIADAQVQYDAAVETEQEQYEAMKVRIRYLYETGNPDLVSIYLETGNIAEALTKADYVEDLYDYDRKMLTVYQETVQQVADLQVQLEQEKEDLLALQAEYEGQQADMEEVMTELQAVADDYEAQIAAAEAEASVYAQQLAAQNAEINRIQEEQRRAAEEAARQAAEAAAAQAAAEEAARQEAEQAAAAQALADAEAQAKQEEETARQNAVDSVASAAETGTITTTKAVTYDVSSIYSASGSDLGKSIAAYACQFIGNPYVAGGTSLTNGADCSGFVYSVYKNFGYTVPRNSYDLRTAGTEVSYADAQPGDILCYPGHVALYIGNGMIVHASTEKTGIKVSNALYRDVLTVRRIAN